MVKNIQKAGSLTLKGLKGMLQKAIEDEDTLGFVFIKSDAPCFIDEAYERAGNMAVTLKNKDAFITFPVKIYRSTDEELENEAFERFCRTRKEQNFEEINRDWYHPYHNPLFWGFMNELGLNESDYVVFAANSFPEKHIYLEGGK